MKNYREVKHCPKCKAGRFAGETDCSKLKYVPTQLKDFQIKEEHMKVVCCSCGYVWEEKCADFVKE